MPPVVIAFDQFLGWNPGCHSGQSCVTFVTMTALTLMNGNTSVAHMGHDGHPKPIVKKPSPTSLEHLKRVVSMNPEAGPAKSWVGVPGSLPMPDIDIAFANKGHLSHLQRGIFERTSTMEGKGIRNSTGALFQLCKDIPQSFF